MVGLRREQRLYLFQLQLDRPRTLLSPPLNHRRIARAHLRSCPPPSSKGAAQWQCVDAVGLRGLWAGSYEARRGQQGQRWGQEHADERAAALRTAEGAGLQGQAAPSCLCCLFPLALLPKPNKGRITNYLLEQVRLGRKSKWVSPLYNSSLLL